MLKIASSNEEDELFSSNQDENAVAKLYDITSDLGNSIPTHIGIYSVSYTHLTMPTIILL